MRFKKSDEKLTIYSVSGNHTVSFGIEMERENCDGLLGFAVERKDLTENENYFMRGFKVFKEAVPNPKEGELYSHTSPLFSLSHGKILLPSPATNMNTAFTLYQGNPRIWNMVNRFQFPFERK